MNNTNYTHLDVKMRPVKTPLKLDSLVRELLSRIEETPNLADQALLFSIDEKVGKITSRWLRSSRVIHQPWTLWSDQGEEMHRLLVLSRATGRVLVFESKNQIQWDRREAVPIDEAERVIPKPLIHTSWMARPATEKQLKLFEKVTRISRDTLPPMSIYSLNSILQIRRMVLKAHVIEFIVGCWEYDIETTHAKQEVLFPYLSKIN